MPPPAPRPLQTAGAETGGDRATTKGRRPFWMLLRRVAAVAALAHACFAPIFMAIGVPAMVWANVASVFVFIGCRLLLQYRRNGLAGRLMVAEVVAHASAATVIIGWDSGFHYYLLALIAPLIIAPNRTSLRKVLPVASLGVFYLALDALMRVMKPLHSIEGGGLALVRYFNITSVLFIISFLSLVYYKLVTAAEQAMRKLATSDPLTGLHNRRHLLDLAQIERVRHARQPRPTCVLLCDIDHFKAVNDTHGHETGDRVLQAVVGALTASVREQDAVARWGGEEFLVLVVDAGLHTAAQTAERIRAAVARTGVATATTGADTAAVVVVTATIGVAQLQAGESIEAAVSRADRALYRGKAAGRNRVTVEPASPPRPAAQPQVADAPA